MDIPNVLVKDLRSTGYFFDELKTEPLERKKSKRHLHSGKKVSEGETELRQKVNLALFLAEKELY